MLPSRSVFWAHRCCNKISARKGFLHSNIRANTTLRNNQGQTAFDIARHFKSRAAINLLNSQKPLTSVKYPTVNYFSHAPLNRRADKRKDTTWLNEQMKNPKSKYVVFSKLKPLAAKLSGEKRFRLAVLSYEKLCSILGKDKERLKNIVFLGIEESLTKNDDEEAIDDFAWFAVDIGRINDASSKFLEAFPGTEYLEPRPGFLQVHIEDATILAQARPILEWHQFNRFCPRCGNAVSMDEGGYKQSCSNNECDSNKRILNVSYPRMDPVGIMLVVSQDGTECLLGRKPVFPAGMYSCLAGYMEPGESIEDAVRREVLEESGIHVGLVEYHSSQFWPYPTQLMIGCLAHATTDRIIVDKEELEDAQWFSMDSVRRASNRVVDHSKPPSLWFPPRQAIARQLIEHWLDSGSSRL
ncbi:peroxisomal NADH pyrophosphatase NUDT12-like isoform X2 [Dendronephthya gigantea]|uniref:peroxisomal NADH pyrophosphatase NUDT12-like isoform X2 n=1 Tax=Dendronephthya gigantea TaxID=151771 RepID=UPI00106C8A01|nr:peroxisomal NADH pyrophosphatase NUDT12-like isoform X2 [Dendronephthya gigantea]